MHDMLVAPASSLLHGGDVRRKLEIPWRCQKVGNARNVELCSGKPGSEWSQPRERLCALQMQGLVGRHEATEMKILPGWVGGLTLIPIPHSRHPSIWNENHIYSVSLSVEGMELLFYYGSQLRRNVGIRI